MFYLTVRFDLLFYFGVRMKDGRVILVEPVRQLQERKISQLLPQIHNDVTGDHSGQGSAMRQNKLRLNLQVFTGHPHNNGHADRDIGRIFKLFLF